MSISRRSFMTGVAAAAIAPVAGASPSGSLTLGDPIIDIPLNWRLPAGDWVIQWGESRLYQYSWLDDGWSEVT